MIYRNRSLWTLLGLICLLQGCTKSDDSSTDDTSTGNWIYLFEMNGDVRSEAVSFVIGDTAYVGTGFDGTDRLQDMWAYNAATNSWYQTASLPGVARNSAVGFAAAGKGYICTGYDGINKLNDLWQYDPSTNSWTQKKNFAGSARYDAVAFSLNDKGYVATGFDGTYLKDVWKYDPSADTWTEKPNNIGSKRSQAVAFVYNNNAYLVTGINNGSLVNDFWKYDPSSYNWTQLRSINSVSDESYDDDYSDIARNNSVAFVMGDYAYLSTGYSSGYNSKTWRYDFANDQWERRTAFEKSARSGAVGFTVQNRGFVTTGLSSTTYLDDVNEFNPTEDYEDND